VVNFSTLEKVNGSYVSDDLRYRADDVVWRIRWGKDWLHVYILLEFQSTVDPLYLFLVRLICLISWISVIFSKTDSSAR
jgi:hypothetical protein